jgi:hypothetical protein
MNDQGVAEQEAENDQNKHRRYADLKAHLSSTSVHHDHPFVELMRPGKQKKFYLPIFLSILLLAKYIENI